MLKLATCSSLHWRVGGTPRDLRAMLKEETGQSFRRINRFIELALLGAARCARQVPGGIPPDTALYLCFDTGMLADTTRILAGYVMEKRAPTPFEFMNTSGGMAGFHVAQLLKLEGPQLAIHRNHASLEAVLQLLTLKSAPHRRALVGYVEEGCWPEAEQRERFGWDGAFAECSHWLYFDADAPAPLAVIERFETVADLSAAAPLAQGVQWLAGCKQNHSAADLNSWQSQLGISQRFDAPALQEEPRIFSGGLPALALSAFAQSASGGTLLHLNQGSAWSATLMRKS